MSEHDYPSQRSMGISPDRLRDDGDVELSASVTSVPWIDPHQHTQTISWDDQHEFDRCGCQAVVMIAMNPHWSPYRPVSPDDVRFLWDLAVKWADSLGKKHLFDVYVAVGIHTLAPVENWEELLDVLPEYAAIDEVVAIGETGIDPVQYASRWPVDDQKDAVRAQMEIAADADVPVIVHTPTKKSTAGGSSAAGWGGVGLSDPDPAVDYSNPKIECAEIDVTLKDEAGLPDDRVVIDHGDPSIVEFVMESTDCYLGFSVSSPLKGVTSEDIADVIHEYGPDRVVIDSDAIGYRHSDMFCIPDTIIDLHQFGVTEEEIRTVVYENPKRILGL